MTKKNQSRRDFIKRTSGAVAGLAAFPYIIPSNIFGKNGAIAPSDKIRVAFIGLGGQGRYNMNAILNENDALIVAVCDVDKDRLQIGRKMVNTYYGNNDCDIYHNYKESLILPHQLFLRQIFHEKQLLLYSLFEHQNVIF